MKIAIVKELKKEIEKTVLFFANLDLKGTGFISESTLENFRIQGVEIPLHYIQFIKPKNGKS